METERNELEEWGLPLEAILGLSGRLTGFYERFRIYVLTQTDDTSEYGLDYLSSLMRMETKRTMANGCNFQTEREHRAKRSEIKHK